MNAALALGLLGCGAALVTAACIAVQERAFRVPFAIICVLLAILFAAALHG